MSELELSYSRKAYVVPPNRWIVMDRAARVGSWRLSLRDRQGYLSREWRLPAWLWAVPGSKHGSSMSLPWKHSAAEAQLEWMDDGYTEAIRDLSEGGTKTSGRHTAPAPVRVSSWRIDP